MSKSDVKVRRVAALVCILGMGPLTPSAAVAALRENIYFREGRTLYEQMEYEKALSWLRQAISVPGNGAQDLAQVEVFIGLCHYALGDIDEANTHFRVALSHDSKIRLPPDASPRIVADFENVRAAQRSTVVAESLPADAPRVAPAPSILVPKALPSPLAASIKEERRRSLVLPITFASSSVVAAGAGIVLGLSARSDEQKANGSGLTREQYNQFSDRAHNKAKMANVAFGLAAATAVTAAVTYLLHL
jgi:tetratricopeptide (TPR) repeat protein